MVAVAAFKLIVQFYKSMSKFYRFLETSQNLIDTLYLKLVATTCVGRTSLGFNNI
jgi:hypothetical protein